MPDKFLTRDATTGRTTEVEATATGGTNAQGGKVPALDSSGRFDPSMMPVGLGADTYTGTAPGALSAGDFVSITSNGVARASAGTAGTDCDGFVLTAVAAGGQATVYLEGRNTALTGLTAGARYYLAENAGQPTSAPVTGAGKRHQFLGRAITATSLAFEPDDAITLA